MRPSRIVRLALVAVACTAGCTESRTTAQAGIAQRLTAGTSDTVIINDERPVQIPLHGVDAAGRTVAVPGAHFVRIEGASLDLSPDGTITCGTGGDALIRVSFRQIETRFLVRCRPVRRLYYTSGPVQFVSPGSPPGGVLSDSSQLLPLIALGPSGTPVDLLAGTVIVPETSVVSAHGLAIRPKRPGSTIVGVAAGGRSTEHGISVHVYKRLRSIDEMHPDDRWISVPITLKAGQMIRWSLPRPRWMFTMLPYQDSLRGLRLRFERANCLRMRVTARRYNCLPGDSASLVVYHPGTRGLPNVLTGEILIYREDRSPAAALRSAY